MWSNSATWQVTLKGQRLMESAKYFNEISLEIFKYCETQCSMWFLFLCLFCKLNLLHQFPVSLFDKKHEFIRFSPIFPSLLSSLKSNQGKKGTIFSCKHFQRTFQLESNMKKKLYPLLVSYQGVVMIMVCLYKNFGSSIMV